MLFQTLAEDILLQILFILTAKDPSGENVIYSRKTVKRSNNELWTSTHVCRHWRYTALNCQRLWSRILLRSSDLSAADLLKIYLTQLERSGTCPLDISIHLEREGTFPGEEWMLRSIEAVIPVLVASSERWCFLSLQVHLNVLPFLAAVEDRIPILRVLSIVVNPQAKPRICFTMFSLAPSLRELTLISKQAHDFDLPFHQLTLFRTVLKPSTYEMLNSARALRSLWLFGLQSIAPYHSTIMLPELETLEITTPSTSSVRCIICPNLTTLDYEIDFYDWNDAEIAALTSLQRQSRFKLKHLKITCRDCFIELDGPLSFDWANTSSIESLHVIHCISDSDAAEFEEVLAEVQEKGLELLEYLTIDPDAPTTHVMPLLTEFKLSICCDIDNLWVQVLTQMVQSRPRLTSLHITYGEAQDEHFDLTSLVDGVLQLE